jgi:SAM-dependent methyltransferase
MRNSVNAPQVIAWPPIPGHAESPQWNGREFSIGPERTQILQYSVKPTGWDDEMANLVEHEVDEHKPIGKASRRYVLAELAKEIGSVASPAILEVGCSTGFLLREAIAAMPNATFVGAEYAYPALERLTAKLEGTPLVQMDLTCAPLPGNSFDAIIALNVLEHIRDDILAIQQVHRMLKPGGVAVIEVPAGPNLYDPFDRHVGHHRRYGMSELINRLEAAGFEIVSKTHLGFFVYPIFWLAKKKNRWSKSSATKDKTLTLQTLRAGRRSKILEISFYLEDLARRFIYLPFGIRCLVTARKRKAK